MKIDYTFKIKEKYFNAIINGEKTFELRHQSILSNKIVKLVCCENNNNYLIYKSGEGQWLEKASFIRFGEKKYNICAGNLYAEFDYECFIFRKDSAWVETESLYEKINWYDDYCWQYINKKLTYLSLINEILEASINGKKWINLKRFVEEIK